MEQREGENEPLVGESICGVTHCLLFTPPLQHTWGGGGTARCVRDTLAGRQTPGALDANYPRGGCEQKGD